VAEALGGDETRPREPLLEQRVGGHRGAVADADDGGPGLRHRRGRRGLTNQPHDLADSVEHADRGVVWRRRCLGGEDLAGGLVDGHDVGERAAGIDADPKAANPRRGLELLSDLHERDRVYIETLPKQPQLVQRLAVRQKVP
jgi:hypothetical protein